MPNPTQIGASFVEFAEISSDPPRPGTNGLALYAKDNGSGITRLYSEDSSGNVRDMTYALEPQTANAFFAGPTTGSATPAFRAIVYGDVSSFVREKLTGARTYFVRTDGSDSNTGLANNAGGAFLTVQKAINTALAIDGGGFGINIQLAAGTYTGAISISAPFVGTTVTIVGDTTTPSNVVISVTGQDAILVTGYAVISLNGLKITTTTAGSCIDVTTGGVVNLIGKMEFGAAAFHHMISNSHGAITIQSNYTISGGALYHIVSQQHGLISAVNLTVTLTGTPAFSGAYALATDASALVYYGHTFSGTATGTRYQVFTNGVIDVNGGGANFLPGNAAGSTASGGTYA